MQRQLSVLVGSQPPAWGLNLAAATTRQAPPSAGAAGPNRMAVVAAAAEALQAEHPDLAVALQRLAGIDPEARQEQYEAIRKRLLKLDETGPAAEPPTNQSDLLPELQHSLELTAVTEPAGDDWPPKLKPLSPEMIVLQAYRNAAETEMPQSLLAMPLA